MPRRRQAWYRSYQRVNAEDRIGAVMQGGTAIREERRTVELMRSVYQPSKVELEETIKINNADGRQPAPEQISRAALQPVDIKWKQWPT